MVLRSPTMRSSKRSVFDPLELKTAPWASQPGSGRPSDSLLAIQRSSAFAGRALTLILHSHRSITLPSLARFKIKTMGLR